MSKQLKPCPFCGGEASAEGRLTFADTYKAWWGENRGKDNRMRESFYCNCIRCGSSNQGLHGHRTRDLAIMAWNTRTCVAA